MIGRNLPLVDFALTHFSTGLGKPSRFNWRMMRRRTYEHNGFKIELARRTIIRALSQAVAGTPQSQTDKRIL
jgi:hypothetical protein